MKTSPHNRNFTLPGILLVILTLLLNGQPPLTAQAAPIVPESGAAAPAFAAVPDVTLNVPAEVFIGQDVSFSVTFDNNDPDPGYGPIIDIIIPSTGFDGDGDGLGNSKIQASFMGIPFVNGDTMRILQFDASCQAVHPFFQDMTGTYATVNCPPGVNPGDRLVVLRLPFGSFTQDQPPATVDVTVDMSNYANVNEPLTILARGGYQFGYTPTNDWCCGDPAWPDAVDQNWHPSSVEPILYTFSKSYNGPEGETATGPNFRTYYPDSYTINVQIAPGQSINSLQISDILPDDGRPAPGDVGNLQYNSLISSSPAGASCVTNPNPLTVPGGTLTCSWPAPVSNAASLTFDFHIPLRDADGNPVLDPASGDNFTSCNNLTVSGSWTPLDPDDDPVTINENPAGCEAELTYKSIAIQKGVAVQGGGEPAPGKILEYTLDFQVSDFFAFRDVVVTDAISDGQHFNPAFTPTLQINGNSYTLAAAPMSANNVNVICDYSGAVASPPAPPGACDVVDSLPPDGKTTIVFNVSSEIINRGQDGKLIGGCVPTSGTGGSDPDCGTYNDGPTTGRIIFQTVIQQNFTDTYPSGDPSVDQGDVLNNDVSVEGLVLSTADVSTITGRESDDSNAGVVIGRKDLTKSIYAVTESDGVTLTCGPGGPIDPCPNNVEVKPGDRVTYRLQYGLLTSDLEDLYFDDFLPLPVFHVDDPDEDGSPGPAWTFSTSGGIPGPGVVGLGPNDTFYAYMQDGLNDSGPYDTDGQITGQIDANAHNPGPTVDPVLSANTLNNRLRIGYATYDDTRDNETVVDLLFTVVVSDDPFADRLYLTNQAQAYEGSTNGSPADAASLVQIILTEPVLVSNKGVVATSNPNAVFVPDPPAPVTFNAPGTAGARWSGVIDSALLATNRIDSDLTGVDGGDLVTFAIVIENVGSSLKGAFDITILDTLPAQFQIPAGGLNLRVANGDNSSAFTFTRPDGTPAVPADLFTTGIRIEDPDPDHGACQGHTVGNGKNILIITYDLQLKDDVPPGSVINTASLTNYAGSDGGPNHLDENQEDDAEVTTLTAVDKTLDSSELENTVNTTDEAVIGEYVTYRVVVTVPEGQTPGATLTDTLDAGLAFVACDSITPSSADLTTSIAGGFASICSNPTVAAGGGQVAWDFGTLTNVNRDDSTPETLTILYRVLPLNIAANQAGTSLNNSAEYAWSGGPYNASGSLTASAENVTIIEPSVVPSKSVYNVDKGLDGDYDANDTIRYTITLQNNNPASTDAFDVTFEDILPNDGSESFIVNPVIPVGGVTDTGGILGDADFEIVCDDPPACAAPNIWTVRSVSDFDFPWDAGRTITIRVEGKISVNVSPGLVVTNTAEVRWTSLDGVVTDRSSYNGDSDERTGADGAGGALNDYAAEADVDMPIDQVTPQKYLVTTSELHTGTDSGSRERVSVGEIVRYRLVVSLPESTLINFQIRDNLPDGMTFLNDGTAKVVFVSDSGVVSYDYGTLPVPAIPAACYLADDGNPVTATHPAIPPACPAMADNNIGSTNSTDTNVDNYTTGADVFFKLGRVINYDDDPDAEYAILEFNALVDNNGAPATTNDRGDLLRNNFNVFVNGSPSGTISTDADVYVSEPYLSLDKAINPPLGPNPDAGDTVTYVLTINASSGDNYATAFDISLTDALNAHLVPLSAVITSTTQSDPCVGNGAGTTPFTSSINLTGQDVTLTASCLDPGSQIVATITARIADDAPAGTQIPNQGQLTYTSLPGSGTSGNPTGSDTPGGSGAENGERDGSDGPSGSPNDHAFNDNADFTLAAPTFTKTRIDPLPGTDDIVQPGELVSYRIVVTLPEGDTESLVIQDLLPTGFTFVSGSLSSGANVTASLASSPSAGDNTLVWVFNSPVTNAYDNVADAKDTLTLDYTVRVTSAAPANTTPLNNGNDAVNTADTYYTPEGGSSTNIGPQNARIDVVKPAITATKVLVPSTPTLRDAGDTIQYQVTIRNTGAAESVAYDVYFQDNLSDLTDYDTAYTLSCVKNPGAVALTYEMDDLSDGFDTTPDAFIAALDQFHIAGDLEEGQPNSWQLRQYAATGEEIVCTYQAVVLTTVQPGNSISNQVDAYLDSAEGPQPGEESFADTPNVVTVTVPNPSISKIFVVSSESGTADTPAPPRGAIGEIMRYRLAVNLIEGTHTNLQILDYVPTGMLFLNDGTARVAFVSDGSGITSSTITPALPGCGGLNVTGTASDLISVPSASVTCPLPDTAVSRLRTSNDDNYAPDTDVWFSLGNVVNSDSDAASNNEYIIIEFNALIANVTASNQAYNNATGAPITTSRGNYADLYLNGSGTRTSRSATITINVAEPVIYNVNKTGNITEGDAGDVIHYTVTFTNTSAGSNTNLSPAYDVRLLDNLPVYVTLDVSSISASGAGGCATGIDTSNSSGNTVDIRIDTVPPLCAVTVEYEATIREDAPAGVEIDNTAQVTYTSLPGTGTVGNPTGSNTPGGSGANYGERNGTSGGNNDYNDSEGHRVTLLNPPAIVKNAPPRAQYTIGEDVTYPLLITLPEGTTRNVLVIDSIPDGMQYIGYSLDVSGYNGSFANNPPTITGGAGDGDDVTFDFGDIVTTDDNDPNNNSFTLNVTLRVLNVAANQNQDTLTNSALLRYTLGAGGSPTDIPGGSQDITVIEPILNIVKSADDSTWLYGQTVTYTLDLSHVSGDPNPANNSTADAYDLIVTDTVPAGLTYSGVGALPANWTFDDSAAPVLTWACLTANGCSLPLGNTAQLSFTATVDSPPDPDALDGTNSTATNNVRLTWTSMSGDNNPGTTTGERDGSDGPTGSPNDYADDADHTGGLELVAIGNRVWYDTGAGGGIANNGIQDGTEAGIPGIAVQLYLSGQVPGTDTPLATTTTDANGYYVFDNLLPGQYFVHIPASQFQAGGALEGYRSSTGHGVDETLDQDTDENGIDVPNLAASGISTPVYNLQPNALRTGEDQASYTGSLDDDNVNFTADFGFLQFVAIGNRVWFDTGAGAHYNNGILDADEAGVNGVTVELYDALDNLIATTTTASFGGQDGYYYFDNLLPGTYYVRIPAAEFQPGGDLQGYVSTLGAGDDETSDNDADENGIDVATLTTTGIRTRNYDLQPNTEQTGEDQVNYAGVLDDDNVNFTADFGFVRLVAIGNRIWFDTGAGGGIPDNGIQDGTEAGVAGVSIELYRTGQTPGVDTPVAVTTTDANGDYFFDLLNPGTYFVHIPASQFQSGGVLQGYVSSTGNGTDEVSDQDTDENGIDNANLPANGISSTGFNLQPDSERSGEDQTAYTGYLDDDNVNFTADFGFLQFVAIGNRVWLDIGAGAHYNNGILDADEVGVNGVTVELYDALDNLIATTTTASFGGQDGYYYFDNLLPGTYYVRIPAAEFQPGGDLQGYVSTLGAGDDETSDNDADENGIDVATLTTTGIRTRNYDLQPNTERTGEDQVNYAGSLDDDNVNFTADFGFVRLVAIGNRIWYDTGTGGGIPDNGIQDGTEAGVAGVSVELYHTGQTPGVDTPVAVTTTDANGDYFFDLLNPGWYFVHIPASQFQPGNALEGYVSSTGNGTDEVSDQDTDENGIDNANLPVNGISSTGFNLQPDGERSGEDQTAYTGYLDDDNVNFTADFGFLQKVAIGNLVWLDIGTGGGIPNNGIQDGTEAGIPGVAVQLYLSGQTPGVDAPVATTTTDANGYYVFDNLLPGQYFVHIPASQFQSGGVLENLLSSVGNGDDEISDQDADENGIDVPNLAASGISTRIYDLQPNSERSGEDQSNYTGGLDDDNVNFTADFGFVELVAIGNRVWLDTGAGAHYNNGILDADEAGVNGVTVELYDALDNLIATTTTASFGGQDGYYYFDNLLPGTYYVRIPAAEFQPGGDLQGYVSTLGAGDDETSDNDADENGIDVATLTTTGIRTRAYTLIPNTERSGEDQVNYAGVLDDDNVNFTADFGFVRLVAIGNRIWFDTGAGGGIPDNGIQDGTEAGVAGVSVELYRTGQTPGVDTPVAVTTSDVNGDYFFDLLNPGTYFVHIPASQFQSGGVLQGYVSSTGNGTDEVSDQDTDENGIDNANLPVNGISSTGFNLQPDGERSGEDQSAYTGYLDDDNVNFTADFGFLQFVAIGNRVWLDIGAGANTNNGILDADEAGVNGVTVELYDALNNLVATTTTASFGGQDGYYYFDNLLPGVYYLKIPASEFQTGGALDGYFSSTGNGSDQSLDQDVDENGIDSLSPWTTGITSITYDLQPNSMRTGEDQVNYAGSLDDDNVNFTADFGFHYNPQVNLSVTKDDGVDYYIPGMTLTYTIVVANAGPNIATDAVVSDDLPANIASWTWTCSGSTGGASGCDGAASSSNNFSDTVTLPANSSITYTVEAIVASNPSGDLVNTVTITPATGTTETDNTDNQDDDTDVPATLSVTKDDGLSVVSPGSTLTYHIVVTNTGSVDLTDITVTDTLPDDVTFQSATPAPDSVAGQVLTWTGLSLTTGASATYDVTVTVNASPASPTLTNRVAVRDTPTDASDDAEDIDLIADISTKRLTNTNYNNDTNPAVLIGEVLTYEITITVPAGGTMNNLRADDVLEAGLAFDECLAVITSSPALVTDLPGGFNAACPAAAGDPNVTNSGHNVRFNFGNVTNNAAQDETITVRYLVDVLDVASNVSGTTGLNNAVTWTWDTSQTLTDSAPPVNIIEPDMFIRKTADPMRALLGSVITFTLEVAHTGESTADAFDVVVTDQLPAGLAYIPGSEVVTGHPPTSLVYDPGTTTLTITWDHFPRLATFSMTFQAVFVGPPPVTNVGQLQWTSFPLDPGVQSNYNPNSTERYYDPLNPAGVNNYGASSDVTILLPQLPATGFAPNRITPLPPQPPQAAYTDLGSLWVEIPRLNVKLPIVGVPARGQGWDLTWLGNQAGWLEGTAYPTHAGNSAITAHTYLADGSPGPFLNLNTMYWGDQIIVHYAGKRYIYEVREVRLLWPNDLSVLRHEEYPWLTLITCKGYVEKTGEYTNRISVRAVLVKVEDE